MIEVFSTNVSDLQQANMLLNLIHGEFSHYRANFDLEDCDRILRVVCPEGDIDHQCVIQLLEHYGFNAAVLP